MFKGVVRSKNTLLSIGVRGVFGSKRGGKPQRRKPVAYRTKPGWKEQGFSSMTEPFRKGPVRMNLLTTPPIEGTSFYAYRTPPRMNSATRRRGLCFQIANTPR